MIRYFFPFQPIKNTPNNTSIVPMIWRREMVSPKKTVAKTIVKIGPMLPAMEALAEPTRLMPSANIKVGIMVDTNAIVSPIK